MKTLVLCSIAVTSLCAQVTVSVSRDGRFLTFAAARSVEALEFQVQGAQPFRQWSIFLNRPILAAGESKTIAATYKATGVSILSVAYSDGTDEGTAARCLVDRREDIRYGGPVYVAACPNPATVALLGLMREYRTTYPGRPEPELVRGPIKNSGYAWFTAGSMHGTATVQGFPVPVTTDWGGNPGAAEGCWGPCVTYATTTAACSFNTRTQIGATASTATGCYNGSSNILFQALYGPQGMGGTASQRFGVQAWGEMTINGVIHEGGMMDSCTYTTPEVFGFGGGMCNN